MFKFFINDLPKQIREILKAKFLEAILQDPAILVADDVIALSATVEQMQEIATECCRWARANGLNWNPEKSQLLRILLQPNRSQQTGNQLSDDIQQHQQHNGKQSVELDGKIVEGAEEADYLDNGDENKCA